MKIVVAVTGASGAIYARQTLECLLASDEVESIALIVSDNARKVISHEGICLPDDGRIRRFDNDDMAASVASGSAEWDAMIVVPASMGTLGRIAAGVSHSLIERAADVMLKERRRLILVVREAPYSLIHLRNMTALTQAGGIILPASPSFYIKAATIDELCMSVTLRAVSMAGIETERERWGDEKNV